MAKQHDAELTLLHIVNTDTIYLFPEGGMVFDADIDANINAMTQRLDQLAQKIQTDDQVHCSCIVKTGPTTSTVVETAAEEAVDLIVLGTQPDSGLHEFLVGSTAYSILKHAPCSVLTVPTDGQWVDFKKIMFPVRPEVSALEKYDFSREIIQKNKAELIVLGVMEYFGKDSVESMDKETNRLVKTAKADGVSLKTVFHFCDSLASTILAKTLQYSADLLIVTSTLDCKLKEFFVGPFARQIVNHAKIPVLSIRTPPESASASFAGLSG